MADEDDESQWQGFSLPAAGLEAMMTQAKASHDRRHMEVELLEREIYTFLEQLSAKQLSVLRTMLNADPKSYTNNYFDGMCVMLLRLVHKADASTGLTEMEAAEAGLKESTDPQ